MSFAPSVENALRMAQDLSWKDFDQIGKPTTADQDVETKLQQKRAELAGAAARCFATEDGREILQMLCNATLFRPDFVSQLGLEPMVAYGEQCKRDGQAMLVSQLLKLAAEGGMSAEPPPAPVDPERPKKRKKRKGK